MLRRQDCQALITAAGLSSRMGRPKALLPWGDVTLVQHQAQRLAGFRDVVVVVGHDAETIIAAAPIASPARYVINPDYRLGRSSSLAAGALALALASQATPTLVVAVDQPLTGEVIEALLAAFDPATHTLAQPSIHGRPGHPLLLGPAAASALCCAEDYPQGLRNIVEDAAAGRILVKVAAAATGWDLNTPDAYAAAVAADETE